MVILVPVLFVVLTTLAESEQIKPIVTIPLGKIEGHIGYTLNRKSFFKFEGVPYAQPPIGPLRLEKPQEKEPWTGTWKANVLTRCIQYDHYKQEAIGKYVVHGDEDCLYVNIYTHSLNPNTNSDVLVHIHGGAFMFGVGAWYGPDIIMDRPIVFVNLNYRLGPLGFLSTEDSTLPGNLGLHDQVKALKWIKENIRYFGGNPDSITLHGLSAGGASVHLHYLLAPSKGLFKQGISQSGCALNPWVLMDRPKEKAARVADLVGCPTGDSQAMKDCLKSRPARSIVQTVKEFQPFLYNPFSPFGIVIDGHWSENGLLADHPYNLLKQKKVQDLPWIISYTADEGLYPAAEFWKDDQLLIEIDSKWNEIIPFILHYNETVDEQLRDQVSAKIRKHYFGQQSINRETYPILVELIGDRLFTADIETVARLQSAATNSDVYSYYYAVKSGVSLSNMLTNSQEYIGVSHGDDTIYITSTGMNIASTENDREISRLLLDMVTSFMQIQVPNITTEWIPLSKSVDQPYLQLKISTPKSFALELKKEIGRSSFWQSLGLEENRNLYSSSHDEL